jgi:hypothetical protein
MGKWSGDVRTLQVVLHRRSAFRRREVQPCFVGMGNWVYKLRRSMQMRFGISNVMRE